MESPKIPTPERLMQLAWGYAPPLVIQSAIEHHLFDYLQSKPQTLQELAAASGASIRGLKAILDALVGLQLLTRAGDRYSLTPESQAYLVSGKPSYRGGFFEHISTQLIPRWLPLTEIVRTGRPAEKPDAKRDLPQFFVNFVESLFPLSFPGAQKLGEYLGISGATAPLSVLDLGAGSGVWGIALAQQSPQAHIRAVDFPQVLEVTRRMAGRFGLDGCLTTAGGDLLEADFGSGHQVATIGHVLHTEGAERSQRLLRRVFDALKPGGTVAIAEFLVEDDRTGPPLGLLFAVNMLVNTEAGDTFSFAQIQRWLEQAGFVNARLLEVPAVSPLVLASKP